MSGGCQTAAETENVVGLTIAEFSARTGLTPWNAYDVAGGRVFIVLGRVATLVTPRAYGAQTIAKERHAESCRRLGQSGRRAAPPAFNIMTKEFGYFSPTATPYPSCRVWRSAAHRANQMKPLFEYKAQPAA